MNRLKRTLCLFLALILSASMLSQAATVWAADLQEDGTAEFETKVFDDNDEAIEYKGANWLSGPIDGAYKKTFHHSNGVDDYATFKFQGTGFTYIASKEFNRGKVKLILDGEELGIFDLYAPSDATQRQVEIHTVTGLQQAEHELKIVVTGEKNESATDIYVDVDAIRVYDAPVEPPVEALWGRSPIEEPYEYVEKKNFTGEEQPYSPDPLVSYRWEEPKAAANLEIFLQRPDTATTETPASFVGLDSITTEDVNVQVQGEGTILLDFGEENAAWLEIDSPDLNGTVTLGISEYNEPAFVNSGPQSPSKTAVPVAYDNENGETTYRLELNSELYEGVRFGFINVEEFNEPFTITDVRLVCQVKPVNYEGSFDSDNEMLNRIWYTAAYDVRVNLRQDYFAAILMDRGDRYSWTGDAYPTQAASLVAFGNFDAVLRNLHYTSTKGNGIEGYELYWVLSLIDYYEYTGDVDGVRGLLTQATSRLDHAYDIYGTNPNLGYVGSDERLGATFENPNTLENQHIYKMNAIRAWSEFADVLDDIGEPDLAEKYRGYAEDKTTELLSDPDWAATFGIHAAADAINAGVTDADTTAELYEEHFTNRVNRMSHSPFNQYFLLQATGTAGEYEDAVGTILDMWGGMIEYGGTTFFENYRPQWNDIVGTNAPVPNSQSGYTSLAHPWGAGVLTWMSEELLGIKADSAGFKTFTVKPHLTSQVTRVSGATPTGNGTIEAAIDIKNGTASLTVPDGTTACYAVPTTGRTITGITMNDQAVDLGAAQKDDEYIYIENLQPGTYQFAITYEGEMPAVEPQPDWEYPVETVGKDDTTQGNWGGVYGSEGYILCGTTTQVLPEYVESVTTQKAMTGLWTDEATDDQRAPASDWFNAGNRVPGMWYTNGSSACNQTFTVDIALKEEQHPYTVALYFVDWDHSAREQVVEMFDLETMNLIAPLQVVEDFDDGVYLIYQYDQSARFRIDQMRGDNAVLSGIFFGTGYPQGSLTKSDVIDDRDPAITYDGYLQAPLPGAYLDTFTYSDQTGASATYTFNGTGISFITSKEAYRGIAEITIDDEEPVRVDLYSAVTLRQQEVFRRDGLKDGTHTIKVVVTGEQNEAALHPYVEIDAFQVHHQVSIDPSEIFPVTFEPTVGGTVRANKDKAVTGETIWLTVEPEADYQLVEGSLKINGEPVTDNNFVMPAEAVTITAKFEYVGGSDEGSVSTSSYTITVTQTTGGKINPSSVSVKKGTDKTFTITANEGYKIADVLVDGKSVGAVSTYTFENVKARHTITAKFEKIEDITNVGGFVDVKSNDWFAEAVQYAVDKGLMNGTSETTFSPSGATTRGMIVTILYRQAGSPKVESDGKTWWSDARAWAMEVGVSDGTNMDKEITREQLATMLYRYAELTGQDVSKSTSLDTFKDSDKVSTYAVEALEWAAAEGIVTGKTGGVIDPQAGATRAETATMLMRFCELSK